MIDDRNSIELRSATPAKPIALGRYDVTGLIRAGGMGTVYDATDREHGTRVALKTLTHVAPMSLRRFKNEFRSVADLSHPNLVPLYELSCHADVWFLTMERIDGVNFIDWLRGPSRRGSAPTEEAQSTWWSRGRLDPPAPRTPEPEASLPLSVPRVREALTRLISAVSALHRAGLLHLDLKPSNVLVDASGRVVVLDFGLVRAIGPAAAVSSDDAEVTLTGTPAWMAPEQYAGESVTEAADWYAVGLMLYLALTGVAAFPIGTIPVMWYAKLHVSPTPPHRLLTGVPVDLSELAMALIDPDPLARPTRERLLEFAASGDLSSRIRVQEHARARLVGREAEGASLRAAFDRVRTGGTAVVHVIGRSGVGKSALLRDFVDEARNQGGALALRGRCYERETVPCKAFDGMLDELAATLASRPAADVRRDLPAWTAELSRVFPVLATVPAIAAEIAARAPLSDAISAIEVRRRAVEALREFVARLASRQPLVLEIDDLQWADGDSVAMVMKLLEAPAPKGLLIVASVRPDEAHANPTVANYLATVGAIDRDHRVEVVSMDLGPLANADAERLATATLAGVHAAPEGLSAAIAAEAGGVPFFVEELARFVAQQRAAGRKVSTAGISLESVLRERVHALSASERALVEVLAVANNPIPVSVAFAVAGIDTGVLRALWALQGGHFVRATGAAADDRVELHHDRMREAVLATLSNRRIDERHFGLGLALAARGEQSPWLFDAVRHLTAVAPLLDSPARAMAARLDLHAGTRARRAGAFPLAFDCFSAGTRLLDADAWTADYELALALHGGAAETAYLSASWSQLDAHIAAVKSHGHTILDQLVAWEVQIDAHIARNEYAAAVAAGLAALRLLGVDLAADPSEADVGVELRGAMAALARVGPEGLAKLPPASDPTIQAAMRIETRISSAAYFARPMLLPVLACRLVTTSVDAGLSAATPYALSIYGIVLNTLGMLPEAHAWGSVAIALLDRFEDKSLEARTRHVVNDLVCTWVVPLRGTLADLRRVVEVGEANGDLEYAAYAAHAYVHNSFYAAAGLEALGAEALAFGAFMRGYGQVNALHVHTPFERLIACFTARASDSASLDGDGFDEVTALEDARSAGSRSAQCIVRFLMGIVRYHFGSVVAASDVFEAARPFLDGIASTWHVPMFHQYAALAIYALDGESRLARWEAAEASLAALRALAEHGACNFAHRVALLEAERARVLDDGPRARDAYRRAIVGAREGGWLNDLALSHELAARFEGAGIEHERHVASAREAYERWGARAKLARLDGAVDQVTGV